MNSTMMQSMLDEFMKISMSPEALQAAGKMFGGSPAKAAKSLLGKKMGPVSRMAPPVPSTIKKPINWTQGNYNFSGV